MEAIVFMLVGAVVAVFCINIHRRGVRFVRAYFYLLCLDDGISVEEANASAAFLLSRDDPSNAQLFIQSARDYADEYHGGRQLSVIYEAQRRGFIG